MNANIALKLAPHAAARTARPAIVRRTPRARVLPRPKPLAISPARPTLTVPTLAARAETVLMGTAFLVLSTLAIVMEAVGASLF